MTDEIESALTEEEWTHPEWLGNLSVSGDLLIVPIPNNHEEYSRHAVAALCLYQQSFGFSQEDVDDLRDMADMIPRSAIHQSERDRLHSLASRIQALLPQPPSQAALSTPLPPPKDRI